MIRTIRKSLSQMLLKLAFKLDSQVIATLIQKEVPGILERVFNEVEGKQI